MSYLLQEIGDSLPVRAFEAHGLEEGEDVFAGSLVDDLAVGEEDDVVEEVVGLRRRLEEGDEGGALHDVDLLPEHLDDLEGGGAVEAGGDLVHEEGAWGPHQHLAGGDTLLLPAGDSPDHLVSDQSVGADVEAEDLEDVVGHDVRHLTLRRWRLQEFLRFDFWATDFDFYLG